jgi:hypothetical protein
MRQLLRVYKDTLQVVTCQYPKNRNHQLSDIIDENAIRQGQGFYNVEKPDGAATWSIQFEVKLLFPEKMVLPT